MASPFDLDKGGSMGRDEYAKLVAANMKRYGGDRDRAVRSANVKAGFGNSTAQRFLHSGGGAAKPGGGKAGGGGGKGGGGGGGATKRAPTPSQPSGPPSVMTSPSSAPGFLPARGPTTEGGGFSPMRDPSLMWQGGTGGGSLAGAVPENAVPPNAAMSLASVLRGVPPELLGGNPNAGFPPFKPGLGPIGMVPPGLATRPPPPRGASPNPYAPAPFDSNNPEFTY